MSAASGAAEPETTAGDHDPEAVHDAERMELISAGVSTAVAASGIGLAVFFFLKRRDAAARMSERFAGLHRVLLNKYYVDEIYDAAILKPVEIVSEEGLWKGMDARGIDGAVNGVGDAFGGLALVLRRIQTGSVRAYAGSLLLGVVVILGYYLWR